MKKIVSFLFSLTFLYACNKEKNINDNACQVNHMPFDYEVQANTLIPINTRNFWTYTDSVFDPQTGYLTDVSSTQINIENVYQVNNLTYFDFTELLSPMTVIGDTLFTVTTQTGDRCYELKKKLFPVNDLVQVGETNAQVLYRDYGEISTGAGKYNDNVVYKDGESLKMYFHEGIGLIKVEFKLGNGMLRRSLTLKDYNIK